MLLDVSNSGRVCTFVQLLKIMLCWELCSVVLQTVKISISYVIYIIVSVMCMKFSELMCVVLCMSILGQALCVFFILCALLDRFL